MIRKFKDRFKRPSDSTAAGLIAAAAEEPKKMSGIPRYARFHGHKRVDSPVYDKTAEFLKRDPLADIPIGSLARPEGAELEAPVWGVDDWLDGQYQEFPWYPEDDAIINEEKFA